MILLCGLSDPLLMLLCNSVSHLWFEINYNHACGNVKRFVQVQLGHLTQVNTTIVNLNTCIAYVMLMFPPETCLSIIIFIKILSKKMSECLAGHLGQQPQ